MAKAKKSARKKAAARAGASKGRRAARKPAAKGGKAGKKRAAPKPPDPEAMMRAWQEAATPAAGHGRLQPLVGSWSARTTFWMEPGGTPSVGEGTSEHRWVLGGRYLEQVYRGTTMGMPFEGLGYTGYDNVQRKYVSTWMDSFGTGIMHSTGVGKPSERKIASTGTVFQPGTRRAMPLDSLVTIQGRDQHTYEMFARTPSGKRFRTMLVEYRRKSG
jgi:hypothetical protein